MKYSLILMFFGATAQIAFGQGQPPLSGRTNLIWQATGRDTLSTTWEAIEQVLDADSGQMTNRLHHYVEIGAGLNYLSDATNAQWLASRDIIELMADGTAAAVHGPAKLYVKPNLNWAGAVTIVTVSNRIFQTSPVGLFWYDPASSKAVLIAQVQDCVGELEPPNQIVFKGAFGQVGDLRLTYTKGAIESDLILLEQPKLPAGFDPTTARIEMWHRWQAVSPPNATAHLVEAPDVIDEILDFGDLWMPTGAAYLPDGRDSNVVATVTVPHFGQDDNVVPVLKQWLHSTAGDVLVEAVLWKDVVDKTGSLPPAAVNNQSVVLQDRSSWLSQLPSGNQPTSSTALAISIGSGYHPTGLVWDYIVVGGGYNSNYSFSSGQTYYVSSSAIFSANVAFNAGCFIKFANGTYLLFYGSITCNGSSGNPSILTAWNDDLFGGLTQTPELGCPTYSASQALWEYYMNSNVSISGIRFRWANTGMQFDANGCGIYSHTVSGCTFEFCKVGIYANSCNVAISGSTRCGVITPTQLGKSCSSFTGSLTDICSGDSDGNGVQDLFEYQYYGRISTLPACAYASLAARTVGHSPSTDQTIWSQRDDVHMLYTYNTSCWLYGMTGLSAFSPWHYDVNGLTYQGAGTLITPRHAMNVLHMQFPDNTAVRFIGTDNVAHQVTCLHTLSVTGGNTDIAIMVFDQDLPVNVARARILPTILMNKLTSAMEEYGSPCYYSANIPIVGCNQRKEAFIVDAYDFFGAGWVNTQPSLYVPNWGSFCYRTSSCTCGGTYEQNGGDSGSPTFLVIHGELVLIGPWTDCGGADWPGIWPDKVNTTITALDTWVSNTYGTNAMTGYSATTYPLDSFPSLW